MAQAKKQRSTEVKGYAKKVRMGLVPYTYDRNGRSFQQGAWKNWDQRQVRQLELANRGEGHFSAN